MENIKLMALVYALNALLSGLHLVLSKIKGNSNLGNRADQTVTGLLSFLNFLMMNRK